MFFSGTMFPMGISELFSIGGYGIGVNAILSPVHAVSALNKTIIMQQGLSDVVPEIISLVVLSVLYFFIGQALYKRKHMKAE